jgi:MoaA/NifB/PqqE/SkfB family radical SAM enzyme
MPCRHLQVEITSRCNLRCQTCLYGHYPERWVPADLAESSYAKIVDAEGSLASVHLQGWGESLLRADIPVLVARARQAGLRVSLSSNGSVMDARQARDLLAAGLDSMAFSFAGATAAAQDPLRGKGSFARAVRAAAVFHQARDGRRQPPLLMNFLLLRGNHRQLGRALGLARRLGMSRLQAGHLVHPVAAAQQGLMAYPDLKPGPGRMFSLRLATLWRYVELVLPSLRPQPTPVCPKNPLAQAFVGADGSVSPCVYLNPPLHTTVPRLIDGKVVEVPRVVMGSLVEDDLETIWRKAPYRDFRRSFKRRVEAYDDHMQGISPDLEGLNRLEKAVDRLKTLFRDQLPPPAACRVCPHLEGF